jgi:hypothetical protein
VSSSQLDLNVLFVLLGIRRIDFGVFGTNECLEEITWQCFRLIEGAFHIVIELFGEGIAVIDPEDAFIDVDVDCDIEILPGVVVCQLPNNLGDFLPLEEDPLRNTCVLYFLLRDVNGFIRQVVVDVHRSDPVILKPALDDVLLEIAIVAEYLPVVLEPGRLHARN